MVFRHLPRTRTFYWQKFDHAYQRNNKKGLIIKFENIYLKNPTLHCMVENGRRGTEINYIEK